MSATILALLGAGALALLWMRSSSSPTPSQGQSAVWFAAAPPATTPELVKARELAIDTALKTAKPGAQLLVSFPIRRSSKPSEYSGGVADIVAYGVAQKIYTGKMPSGTEGRVYDVKLTSFLGAAPDLPAVGTVLTVGNDSVLAVTSLPSLNAP